MPLSEQSLQATPRPINVLAQLPGILPSTLMDVVKPMLYLQRTGQICFRANLEIYPWQPLEWADLLIFCRNIEPRYQLLDRLLLLQKPFIYDLDDNFFAFPLELAEASYYREPARQEQLRRYLRQANLVRVYSPALLDQVQSITDRVQLVRAPLDWSVINHPSRGTNPSPTRIVYATSRQDDEQYRIFAPALRRLLEDMPGQVEITFWGVSPPEFRRYANIKYRPYTANYDRYLRQFSRLGFDIGLAPLPDQPFYHSKTENKFREYAACRIAGIYSDTLVYRRVVEPGVTGLLVENTPEAWYQALVTLVSNPTLRSAIAEKAQQRAKQLFPSGEFEQVWWEQIQAVLTSRAESSTKSSSASTNMAPQVRSTKLQAERQLSSPSSPGNSYQRFRQQIKSVLASRQPGVIAFHVRFHLQNLWWLAKINWLKRI